MTEVSDDLRARFDAGVPLPAIDDAAVGSLLHRARRRRRVRQVSGGGAALGALAALVVGAMSLGAGTGTAPAAPPADGGPVDALAVDREGASLWLSATEVPPGAEVVGVLLGKSVSGVPFDQLAVVERWEGGRWVDHEESLLWCTGTDGCDGQVLAPGTQVDYGPVVIEPGPGAPGPVMRMSTEGLEPGWYRIKHVVRVDVQGGCSESEGGGMVCTMTPPRAGAWAVLEVKAGAPEPAPLPSLEETHLVASPPVLTAGLDARLALDAVVPDGDRPDSSPVESARVEVWDGAWVPVDAEVAVAGAGDALTVQVPGLDPGAYRVVLTRADGQVWASFWVDDRTVVGDVEG